MTCFGLTDIETNKCDSCDDDDTVLVKATALCTNVCMHVLFMCMRIHVLMEHSIPDNLFGPVYVIYTKHKYILTGSLTLNMKYV